MKDKEWAKCIVRKELKGWQNIEGGIDEDGIKYILDIIDQLGEPKVPEVPVVPEEVYEYMTQQKRDRYTIQQVFYQVHWNYKNESMAEEEEWVSGNEEEFAKAWLAYPNIEVEKEQKYYAKLKEIRPLEGEWLTNLSGPNYYVLDTKGLMLGEFMLDLVGMKTEASTHTLKDWERYGINDSNADFVKAEELEE